tara:strand:+ start:375 stop:701 length:327 start_codon:yes stop_codon:yes gene_type:complete
MKIKVSEATNLQIDWLVAKCAGNMGHKLKDFWLVHMEDPDLQYSTNWNQGGPILEREKIQLGFGTMWSAFTIDQWPTLTLGETPLIAAMRCFIASRLGDEVDVPEELK